MTNGQREQRRYLTKRATVDPRVSFDVTTPALDVFARTTDPMVFDGNARGRAQRLAEALGVVNASLPLVGQALEAGYKREYSEGTLSALKGEERPSEGLARIIGYETLKGEFTAQKEYKAEVLQFYNDNHQVLSPEEFEQGLVEISKKYIEGASKHFLEGFLPVAVDIEQKVFENYTKYQQESVYNDTISFISQKAYDDTVDIVNTFLEQYFEGVNLDNLRERLDVYYMLENGDYGQVIAPLIRQSLTDAQNKAELMGLSKKEVSRIYLENIGRMAVEYGLPELLEFAYVKDESGISIARRPEGSKADSFRLSAVEEQMKAVKLFNKAVDDYLTEQEKAEIEAEQERVKGVQADIRINTEKILATGTPDDAWEYFLSIQDTPEFRAMGTEVKEITRKLLEHANKETIFQTGQSKQFALDHFALKRVKGFYDPNEALDLEEIQAYKEFLTESDYLELISIYYAQRDRHRQIEDEAQRIAQKAAQDQLEADLNALLMDITKELSDIQTESDPAKQVQLAYSLRERFLNDPLTPFLDEAKFKEKLNEITKVATQDIRFDSRGNPTLFAELRRRASLGELDWDGLMAIMTSGEFEGQVLETGLSQAQFDTLTNIIANNEVKAKEALEKKVLEDQKEAERKRQAQIEADQKEQERQKKLAKEQSMKDVENQLLRIPLIQNFSERSQAIHDLISHIDSVSVEHEWDATEHGKYMQRAYALLSSLSEFPKEGDAQTYTTLRYKAVDGSLTYNEIQMAVDAGLLSESQYNILVNNYEANQDAMLKWPHREDILAMERQIIDVIAGRNEWGVITGENALLERVLMEQFIEFRLNFLEEHGRYPTYWEWLEGTDEFVTKYITKRDLKDPRYPSAPTVQVGNQRVSVEDVDTQEAFEATQPKRTLWQRIWNITPPPNPSWALSPEVAVDVIQEAVDEGYSIDEIMGALGARGVSGDAQTYYRYVYSTDFAMQRYWNMGISTRSRDVIAEELRTLGFTESEILTAINTAEEKLKEYY